MLSVAQNVPGASKEEYIPGSTTKNCSDLAIAPEAIKLSTLKSLWFPIFRNFTSLILGKSEIIRNEALISLERTLDEHHAHFGKQLWREIFS